MRSSRIYRSAIGFTILGGTLLLINPMAIHHLSWMTISIVLVASWPVAIITEELLRTIIPHRTAQIIGSMFGGAWIVGWATVLVLWGPMNFVVLGSALVWILMSFLVHPEYPHSPQKPPPI